MVNDNDLAIHDFCEGRWEFYLKRDGGYFPSKHDGLVFQEAANEFNVTPEEAIQAFDRVSKVKAEAAVKGLSISQMRQKLIDIVEGNAETPWGQEKLNNQVKNAQNVESGILITPEMEMAVQNVIETDK